MAMTGMVSNSVNFGSRPLYQLKLHSGADKGLVGAVVSELDPNDTLDVSALQKVVQSWDYAKYTREFFLRFSAPPMSQGHKYFAVELQEEKPLHKRIVGLAKTHFQKTYSTTNLDLCLLQTRPDIMHRDGPDNSVRKIKGVGEVLVGQAFRHASETESPSMTITSSNDYFYYKTFKKSGVEIIDDREYDYTAPFTIKSDNFDKYLDYIKQTYYTVI